MVQLRRLLQAVTLMVVLVPVLSAQSPAEGEPCLICRTSVVAADQIEQYRGRRVAVCEDCSEAWSEDPERWFESMRPRGALFQEGSSPSGPVGTLWFGVGLAALAGVLCGAAAACVAVSRGRSPGAPFFAGLALNLVGLIGVLLLLERRDCVAPPGLAKVPTTAQPRRCEACGRDNHPAAAACSGCGAVLSPTATSEVERLGGRA